MHFPFSNLYPILHFEHLLISSTQDKHLSSSPISQGLHFVNYVFSLIINIFIIK
jgi:hypothetical protein